MDNYPTDSPSEEIWRLYFRYLTREDMEKGSTIKAIENSEIFEKWIEI